MLFSSILSLLSVTFITTIAVAAPIPLPKGIAKLDPGDVITCGTGKPLNSHDCNVAFLSMGGSIAGAVQFLRVNGPTTTGSSGSCKFTAQVIDGGNILNASKGRLEHGQQPMMAQCNSVAGSSVKIIGGTNNGGNVLLTISPA